jgi:hypothetical protein
MLEHKCLKKKKNIEGAMKSQLVRRKKGHVTIFKKATKKMKKCDKKNTIEIDESEEEEEEMTRIKCKDFEVHHLIAIRGEMDEKSKKHKKNKEICFWIFNSFL